MRHFEVFLAMMLLPLPVLAADHAVPARVATLTIDPREVTILHLRPEFESSIRMPEDVTSVILGSPGAFKAEHNEGEPQYVYVKPITKEPAQSNLLIATKSGQHVTIELISAGASAANDTPPVDFLIEYRTARSFLVAGDMPGPQPGRTDKAQERKTNARPSGQTPNSGDAPRSALDEVFAQQAQINAPEWTKWEGRQIETSVGQVRQWKNETVVAYSIFNNSEASVEIVPPQIQITGRKPDKEEIEEEQRHSLRSDGDTRLQAQYYVVRTGSARRRCGRLRPTQLQRVHRTAISPDRASGSGRPADSDPASVHSADFNPTTSRKGQSTMSIIDNTGSSINGSTAPAGGAAEPGVSQGGGITQEQPAKGSSAFATRADKSSSEGLSKGKLLLLGGGLAIAILFFIFTAIAGKTPKKQIAAKPQAQQQKQAETKPAKGSVTPVMDTVRTAAPDNAAGQLGPGDIRRTRALTGQAPPKSNLDATEKPATAKPLAGRTLASVPTFEETQQKWEDPVPYGNNRANPRRRASSKTL